MKFPIILTLSMTVLAAPSLERRQNDTPECVDGIQGPGGSFNTRT